MQTDIGVLLTTATDGTNERLHIFPTILCTEWTQSHFARDIAPG